MSLNSMRPASPLVPGYTLDRYELLRPIAEGGMASVWIARLHGKRGFEKLVAVKTILPRYAADAAFQEMLLDEARVASRIHHLNVAQILDLGEEQGILYLVAEWIDGDSLLKLNELLTNQGLIFPHGILLRILADTCAGLHAAHQLRDENENPLGVVHRDVSPQNILVSAQGIAKLIDFGIAKARNRFARDTNSGIIKGKIQYMSPEQARGLRIDRRADIWAVGTILYWLLAGKVPYDAGSPVHTLRLVAAGRRPAPLPASVHPAIRALIDTALSPSLDARFATAADMSDAIERAMIAAKATATTADVAAFIGKHMGERALARRYAISLAIKAATNWQSLQRVLKRSSAPPSSLMASRSGAHKSAPMYQAIVTESGATTLPNVAGVTDQRADILAIGTILSRLLNGRDDDVSVMNGIVESSKGSGPLSESMQPAIRAAINTALSPQLDARFSAAADLCEAIERAMIAANALPTTTAVAAHLGKRQGERPTPPSAFDLAAIPPDRSPSSRQRLQLPSPSSYGLVGGSGSDTQTPTPVHRAIVTESSATTLPDLHPEIDRRVDVPGVAAVLAQMLSGNAPYDAGSLMKGLGLVAPGDRLAPLSEKAYAMVRGAINDALRPQLDGRFSAAADLCGAIERAMVVAKALPTTTDVAVLMGKRFVVAPEDAVDLAIGAAVDSRSARPALSPSDASERSLVTTRPDWERPAPSHGAPVTEPDATMLPLPEWPAVPDPARWRSFDIARRIALPQTRRGWAVLGLAVCIAGLAALHVAGHGRAADLKPAFASPMLSNSETVAAFQASPPSEPAGDPPAIVLEPTLSTGTEPSRRAAAPASSRRTGM